MDWWLRHRARLQADCRPAFDSLVLLVTWALWKERNARVFRGIASSLELIRREVVREAEMWSEAGVAPLSAFVLAWSQQVVDM